VCRDNQRAQAFAKARRKVERSWRAMTQKLNTMKHLMQFTDQSIDLRPETSTPVFAQKIVDRGEMAMNNFLPP
jgi:hypothetical protein